MTTKEKYKYKMIENYIHERIRSGAYHSDSLLPTQQAFCEQFQVSRRTVNKAMESLVENGLVEKIQGSGCYVRTPKLSKQSIYMASFSEEYTGKGFDVSTKLLFYTVKRITDFQDRSLSKKLGVLPNSQVHYFERVRFGNERPFAVQYTYITKDIIPELPLAYLKSSIYSYIEHTLRLTIGDGSSVLSIILPPSDIALLLKIKQSEPVVYISHISRLQNGVIFEYSDSYIRYDTFTLLYSNKREK